MHNPLPGVGRQVDARVGAIRFWRFRAEARVPHVAKNSAFDQGNGSAWRCLPFSEDGLGLDAEARDSLARPQGGESRCCCRNPAIPRHTRCVWRSD